MSSTAVGRSAVSQTGPLRTDFSRFTQAHLAQMLYRSDPDVVTSEGDTWSDVGKALYNQASDIEQQLAKFRPLWTGQAADAYHSMIGDLIEGIRQVASTSLVIRDIVYPAGEALRKARASFPPPVPVPTLDPAVITVATTPLPADPSIPPATFNALRTQQAEAVAAIRQFQQAQ